MPNADRITAAGLEWECPPLAVFIDDVSGNSSKQWNVHYSCYISNCGLPRAEIEKSRNIQFVSTSPNASPMEIISAVCDDIRYGSTPLKVWDVRRQRCILVRLWILFLPGDNPMQAELCSHIGLKGNHFCRCCHVGGDQKYKVSDEGYASLLKAGQARCAAETRSAVLQQLIQATHAAAQKPLREAITSTGTKDSLALPTINRLIALGKILRKSNTDRKAFTPEEVNRELSAELLRNKHVTMVNPLLDMKGLEVHRDTPVEPLHTHLLGIVKYFWAQTVWVLEKQGNFVTFQARLHSLAKSGLNIPNILADYMCRYRGALIGKHFKTISQVMSFAVCGLVDDNLQNAWLAVGSLTVLLWETDIESMPKYQEQLRKSIDNVLDHAVVLSPGLLTEKNKLHILLHIPEHIARHGPSLLFSTERYESFNHIFRLSSIHSNRQAPSRDIASSFANQDRCRHMVTGGYWCDKASGQWVCASKHVRDHIGTNSIDAKLLGVPINHPPIPGRMTLAPPSSPTANSTSRRQPTRLSWSNTTSVQIEPLLALPNGVEGPWHSANSVVTLNGDSAALGTELPSISAAPPALRFASVVELLPAEDPNSQNSLVIVRESILQPKLHPKLQMPVVKHSGPLRVLLPRDIICIINVQHDCSRAECTSDGKQTIRQEREDTSQSRPVVSHKTIPLYVLNMQALHNHRWIRLALPNHLKAEPISFPNCDALHRHATVSLRDTKLQK
ncbi:hypothetical protein BD310DRAFT_791607, partial [Dichomitus squalens]